MDWCGPAATRVDYSTSKIKFRSALKIVADPKILEAAHG